MKRYDRVVSLGEIVNQVGKYKNGIEKILRKQNPSVAPYFEIIVLIGQFIKDYDSIAGQETVKNTLEPFNARVVYYDGLISDARNAYSAYFSQKDKLNPILDIFSEIDE